MDDLENRLTYLSIDITDQLNYEAEMVKRALERAIVDEKNIVDVVYALRLEFLSGLTYNGTTNVWTHTNGIQDLSMYDTLFDTFHYDIGHGKGTGTGATYGRGYGAGHSAGLGGRGY